MDVHLHCECDIEQKQNRQHGVYRDPKPAHSLTSLLRLVSLRVGRNGIASRFQSLAIPALADAKPLSGVHGVDLHVSSHVFEKSWGSTGLGITKKLMAHLMFSCIAPKGANIRVVHIVKVKKANCSSVTCKPGYS